VSRSPAGRVDVFGSMKQIVSAHRSEPVRHTFSSQLYRPLCAGNRESFRPSCARLPQKHARDRCQLTFPLYAEAVGANAKSRRRWFGGLCLIIAISMLIAGETVFRGRLADVTLVCYWLGCFVATALAAGAALIDAAQVRAEQREEQRRLVERTLGEIERDKLARKNASE